MSTGPAHTPESPFSSPMPHADARATGSTRCGPQQAGAGATATGRRRAATAGRLGAVVLAALLGACATKSGGEANQELSLRPVHNGERADAVCDLDNGQSRWHVTAPTRIQVTRSSSDIRIECRTGDGATGTTSVTAQKSGGVGGAGGRYGYPDVVTIEIGAPAPAGSGPRQGPGPAFASLDDVASVPYVGAAGREAYRRFLRGPAPRAFVVSDKGDWVRVNATRSPEAAALSRCQSRGSVCHVYAVDDAVVWQSPVRPVAASR